ncbi:hypothetical protein PT277_03585 [Acetobacteraceae bacterium ESL0709]|nr:hypothetical protein [Acetobacteraceae bacterium ESL0697]MDF7677782.1 hypothetical protein [Acetobacteraceae bacterium ESL0709]
MSHVSFLNVAIGTATVFFWGSLFYIREKDKIKSWFVNRFTHDKIPELPPLKEGEEPEQLLPFPYDAFRPKPELKHKHVSDDADDTTPETPPPEPDTNTPPPKDKNDVKETTAPPVKES